MGRKMKVALGAIVALAGVVGLNVGRVHLAAWEAVKYDDVNVAAYYQMGVIPDAIVYDVWDLGPTASQAEVLGGFLRFADQLKDREFREVRLAFRGETKFILPGRDFAVMGDEYDWQNPVYTILTFPEKLTHPDGRPAFDSWSGGWIGVMSAQMDDVNELGREWYLDDLLGS